MRSSATIMLRFPRRASPVLRGSSDPTAEARWTGWTRWTAEASCSAREHAHARAHEVLLHQGRPEADDLGRLRTAAGEAGDAGRAAGHERHEFHPEAVDRLPVVALH